MSTNPFRRTDRQQDADSQLSAGRSALLGDSSRSNELCVDTRGTLQMPDMITAADADSAIKLS